ncbi:uncharacterized protein [Parasteatoda tepidariorum]|uniref:uncharacterized protein isoform X1 n=1 Tax=Parasteatoda tepidariorum TaxID=114398 RepID=UPI001C71DCA2|nr:uncharacterized protein LOC107439167 isoform X1 [Parasteatoda tepidariorum]
MSSTEFTVGLEGGRNSSKVLKPPGGGSSDIFGVGSSGSGVVREQGKRATTTKSRLFGEGEATPLKTYVRRNPITGEGFEVDMDDKKEIFEELIDDQKPSDEEKITIDSSVLEPPDLGISDISETGSIESDSSASGVVTEQVVTEQVVTEQVITATATKRRLFGKGRAIPEKNYVLEPPDLGFSDISGLGFSGLGSPGLGSPGLGTYGLARYGLGAGGSGVVKEQVKRATTTKSRLFGEGKATPERTYVRRNPITGEGIGKTEKIKARVMRNPITGEGIGKTEKIKDRVSEEAREQPNAEAPPEI